MQIDDTSAHRFARALLSSGPGVGLPSAETRTFRLPRLRLTTRTSSAGYGELCRHALVDMPELAEDVQYDVEISVADYHQAVHMPRPRWSGLTFSLGRLVDGLERNDLNGSYDVDHDIWQFFEPHSGTGVQALAEAGRIPPWEASFPLRNFLHWAYNAIGMRLVHAGTLGTDGTGVLLVGAGGSGKSGTTLAGVVAGLSSVGDDYVAVDLTSSQPRAYPVNRLMKQDAAGLSRVGLDLVARGFGSPNWQGKYEIAFEAIRPSAQAPTLDLGAILLPRLTDGGRTRLRPATRHEAMMALAPSNLQQLPGTWKQGLSFSANLARGLPAYHLELGHDAAEVAECVANFIEARAWAR